MIFQVNNPAKIILFVINNAKIVVSAYLNCIV